MPKPPLPDELQALLREPNPAVMASLKPDGGPLSVATWYLWDDGRVLVNLDHSRARLEHLRADPRVSLTVLDTDDWYRHVSLRGRVTEIVADEGSRTSTGSPTTIAVSRIATARARASAPGSRSTAGTPGTSEVISAAVMAFRGLSLLLLLPRKGD